MLQLQSVSAGTVALDGNLRLANGLHSENVCADVRATQAARVSTGSSDLDIDNILWIV